MRGGPRDRRVKTALDETRLLILGAQILFGFHLNGAFQSGFSDLSPPSRGLHALSFLMMTLALALLIAPSLQHRLVDGGRTTNRILTVTTQFAGIALFPFALSLGADLYIVIGYRFGTAPGVTAGIGFTALAMAAWYGAEWLFQRPKRAGKPLPEEHETPIDVRVEHMLTEARVLLPGAQALLGFQLAVMLTEAFAELGLGTRIVHVVALCCTSLAVILLMAPAAFHRITYDGENTESFHRLGSALILAAAVPLGGGIVGDLYVAAEKGMHSSAAAATVAGLACAALVALWLIQPLMLRAKRRR